MNEIVKKNGLKFGIIMAVVSVLITASIYAINLEFFTSMWVGIISIIISLALGVIVVRTTKKELGGQITFKDAFTSYFMAAVIGSTISVLFNIVLFNYIDPAAKETLRDLTTKYAVEVMQKFGAPASAINEAVADMQKTDNWSPSKQLFGLLFSFVLSAILGLILALIFKSKTTSLE